MLGEIHCLVNDFPKFETVIDGLIKTDKAFARLNERYNTLDEEIRRLELEGVPVADSAIHSMKHERAELKDSLYQLLTTAKS